MAELPEGTFEHGVAGKLEIKQTARYTIVSLEPREPHDNDEEYPAACYEWFFNLDGTFDGTGTGLTEPVAAE